MTADQHRYTGGAIVLHWAIAFLILANLGTGLVMEDLAKPLKDTVTAFHFSSGVTVLALSVLRVLWRLTHRPPPLLSPMPRWERLTAHTAHALFYVLMIVMPIVGWMIISAHPPRPLR